MTKQDLERLKFPIGKFKFPEEVSQSTIENWISDIETLPKKLIDLVEPLTETQLDTPYRPEGWKVKQLVHHMADSHTHAFIRFKWTLTEDTPTIKAYDQNRFAELPDSLSAPVSISLDYLKTLHSKWVFLLKNMKREDFDKCFIHPETGKEVSLLFCLGMYAWHGNHHYAHIANLVKEKGW